jgi:hypothetical protein
LSTSITPANSHSTTPPYSFIILSSMLQPWYWQHH